MEQRNIPFFSMKKQVLFLQEKLTKAFADALATQQFVGGPVVASFEQKLAHYLQTSHVISCNSGTDGLWLALKALDLKPQSIVLTTPYSFVASASEIIDHGAFPVFIDIDEKTFNINPELLSSWLEQEAFIKDGKAFHKKTNLPISGIITVDLYGQCAPYASISQIAEEWNLWIVEDACQAIGSEYEGYKAGTLGTIGVLSFYPTKNLGAFGDAGCCLTNDKNLAQRMNALKNHGRSDHYNYKEYGINSRMDAIQAAILSIKLDYVDCWNEQRQSIAHYYQENLASHPLLTLPQERIGKHSYHHFPLIVANNLRTEFIAYLAEQGIGTQICYPRAFTQIPFLNPRSDLIQKCPVAERIANNIVSLPIWPELEEDELSYICSVIKSFDQPKRTIFQQQAVLTHGAQ